MLEIEKKYRLSELQRREVIQALRELGAVYEGEDAEENTIFGGDALTDGGVIRLSVEGDGGKVRFVVRDEGLGIPPAERQRIFEKFYRLDPNLTRGVGGTGLGLYICRELVEQMGGRLSVAANDQGGSSFAVELPTA